MLTVDGWRLTVESEQSTVNSELEFTIPMLTDLIWGLSDSCKGISLSNNSRNSCQATGQRFLDLPQLILAGIWFPLITYWLTTYCRVGQRLSIAIDPTSMGLYKSLHGQLNLAATQPSHCTSRCCANWETVTYLNLPSLSNKFYRYLKNIKSLL